MVHDKTHLEWRTGVSSVQPRSGARIQPTVKWRNLENAAAQEAKECGPRRKPWGRIEEQTSPGGAKERCDESSDLLLGGAALPALRFQTKRDDRF